MQAAFYQNLRDLLQNNWGGPAPPPIILALLKLLPVQEGRSGLLIPFMF